MKNFTLLIFLCIILSSCGIYRQNIVNFPALQHKGQANISAHISFNGLEGQAGLAITDKIAIMGSYQDMGSKKKDNYIDKHNFKEIGIGMFRKNKKEMLQDLFFIAGKGMTSHIAISVDSSGTLKSQKVSYNRFVVQADFGKSKKYTEYAVSPRLFIIHYKDIADNTRSDYLNLGRTYLYAEAAFTFRIKIIKYLKVSSQLCATLPLVNGGYNYYYEFSPFNYSLGLIADMDLFKSSRE